MTKNSHKVENEVIKLTGQLFKVSTVKDGGSRIVIDVGYESLTGVQELIKMNGNGEINLAIVIAPYFE
jgi:hypothetical protein